MRTLKKTIVFLITAALLLTGIPTAFAAEGDTGFEGDFDWLETSTDVVSITDYTGVGGSVTIPATLSGKTVSEIDAAAFRDATHAKEVTEIIIQAPITSIADESFSGCTSLESVTFDGPRITEIGEKAFYDTALTSIKIPASVTSIGADAFNSCNELATVTFDTGTTANPGKLNEIGNDAFSGTKLESVRIPASVETIGDDAFRNCADLASLTFAPECAAAIGNGAFYGTKLVSISIPEEIASIGDAAFSHCAALEKAIINSAIVPIGVGAFEETGLLTIYAPNESTAHDFCRAVKPYEIPFRALETTIGGTSITSAVSTGSNRITITWSEAERASEYEVWRADSQGGTFYLKATTAETAYTNTGLSVNTTYYYKVRGLFKPDETRTYYGSFSEVITVAPLPSAPNSAYAVSTGYDSINLSWTPVPGVSGYEIYRAYDKIDNPYSLVKTLPKSTSITSVKPNAYKFTSLSSGRKYYYKVRAYVNGTVSGTTTTTKFYGAFSGITMARPVPAAVTNLKATQVSPSSIKLTWNSVAGRTRYEIWRMGPNDTKFVLYPYTTSNTYFINDRGILVDKEFSYQVRAYRSSSAYGDSGKVYGAFSNIAKITTNVRQVTGVVASRSSNTQIKISWSSLTGVSGYQVQWALSDSDDDADWTTLYTGTSRYKYHTKLTDNTKYYYRVRAYKTVKAEDGYPEEDYPDGKSYGDWSTVKSATP